MQNLRIQKPAVFRGSVLGTDTGDVIQESPRQGRLPHSRVSGVRDRNTECRG